MSVPDAYVYALHERIEELEAKLAEVTEERDALRMQSTDLINDTVSTGMARDEALNQLDSERYSVEVLERRIRELLPRAYQMGVEAGAQIADACDLGIDGNVGDRVAKQIARNTRALTPPADLAEQCKRDTSHD